MIRRISYLIRFPLGASLKYDVKYLLIKKIYGEIKKLVCLNNGDCSKCSCNNKCIYYMLSGENFKEYPSILVKRDFFEQKVYKNNDVFEVNFYMIGIASAYFDFIIEYMKTIDYISGYYFQKHILDNSLLDEEVIDNSVINIKLIKDIDEILNSVQYYNKKYNASIEIPIIIDKEEGIAKIDYNDYIINGCKIKISGKNYKLKVKKYSNSLLESGVGKNAILGGGIGECE